MLEDLLAQEQVKQQLRLLQKTNNIPNGMIMYGPARVGKFRAAMSFAKSLNCRDGGKQPCKCSSCKKTENGTHPDFHLVKPNDNGQIGIDQVRMLAESLRMCRNEGTRKVVVIKSAHCLNNQAANAILKTLEEPSEDTTIILTTNQVDRLLSTILSRCQMVRFSYLSDDAIKQLLSRDNQIPDPIAISMMAGTYSPERLRDEFVLLRHLWDGSVVNLPPKIEQAQLSSELHQFAHIVNYLLVTGGYQFRNVQIIRPNPDKLRDLYALVEKAVSYADVGVRPPLVINWFTNRYRELIV